MPQKSSHSKGIKNFIAAALALFITLGLALGFLRANNITTVTDALEYGRAWSAKIKSCGLEATIRNHCLFDNKTKSYKNTTQSSHEKEENTISDNNDEVNNQETGKNSTTSLQEKLNSLRVKNANEKASYSRKEWKHWIGSPCNTREIVLKEQGNNVIVDDKCSPQSGVWTDVYSGEKMTDPKKIDIDHVVPLKWANAQGGDSWDSKKKEAFANDTSQLLAVSARENRAKGALGPSEYMPPNKDYTCTYVTKWIETLSKYELSIPPQDKQALQKGLQSCEGEE